MYKVVNDYCTNIFVNKNEIESIRILYDKKMKMSQWYSKYKPDIMINAALFNMSNGIPIESFVSNGKTYSTSDWCKEGFGIRNDGNFSFGILNNTYKDFMVGFPYLTKNGKIDINFDIGASLSARQPRSVLSYNEKTNEIVLTTIDGRQAGKPGKTIKETAQYINQFGVTHSINMDGGGSTRMLVNGQVVNSPSEDRAVSSVLAIWLKKETKPTTNNKGSDKMKICLDYGHNNGTFDSGASYYGVKEQDITYDIGKKLKELLEYNGIEVVETRPTPTTKLGTSVNTSLQARVKIANDADVDYFISLHTNAHANTSAKGTETYVIAKGGKAEKLANAVNTSLYKEVGTTNRGVKTANYYVVKYTDAPAILVEMAFLSNKNECELLLTKQNDFARGMAKGICSYLGITYKDKKVNSEPVSKNKYSYDNTVEKMVELGITDKANIVHWEQCLAGKKAFNKDEVRTIFDRFITKINK